MPSLGNNTTSQPIRRLFLYSPLHPTQYVTTTSPLYDYSYTPPYTPPNISLLLPHYTIIPILPPTPHPIYHYDFPIIRLFLYSPLHPTQYITTTSPLYDYSYTPPYTPPNMSLRLPHHTIIPILPPTPHPIYHYYFPIINTSIGITNYPIYILQGGIISQTGQGVPCRIWFRV